MSRIQLVDYGAGNLRSVASALKRLDIDIQIVRSGDDIKIDQPLILPGVGAAAEAMRHLQETGIASVLPRCTAPTLGICLGMQLMLTHSEEGHVDTLGIFPGTVRLVTTALKLPHMGWNSVQFTEKALPLLADVPNPSYFYFAHSYAADTDAAYVVASCMYDSQIPVVIRKNNFWGIQCHPEKSGDVGMQVLTNFARMVS
ncbi:MAG: imidazole glycerol phosphate synthase subunit HisH [Deltaproteobacteria bacterium CG11_big_fil_rev_8_21_14_0_20_47_16]|nr:MAG: imidazole glycerol phosphate synthase subunit HisH [Deltaproteobacteria bacterium CG11_big_fil_rev_8_21_14_0_20_47_16]